MDEKTLHTLEYPKILEQLAGYASFSASAERCRALRPTHDHDLAREWLRQTTEARTLMDMRPETTIGGAHDVRPQAEAASRGATLLVGDFLDIKATLVSARELFRLFDRLQDEFPALADVALRMPPPLGLIDTISQVISERGDVRDNATPKLARLRRDLRIVHDRLLTKMQRMLSDPQIAPYLQDNLITQRDGRYVIPLRADFKGKVRAVIHDQSSSGATLFVEPLTVVDMNNEYRELELQERDEVRRILAELSVKIGERALDLEIMVETIAEIDTIFSKAKYAERQRAHSPALHPFPQAARVPRSGAAPHPGSVLRLPQARHPLLDADTVVPIDFVLDEKTYALIITGPNTGGKTVTLKTIGLLALMAQSGLHLPTEEEAALTVFENIYADIGDEQSIEQSLSTFSGHITNIVRILHEATPRSLVIFDELGSGTDPQEGAALAMSILVHLLERGITTLVATHYPELKTFALTREGLVNASVEFDIETLAPTFHLIIGLPGRSNALSIAERLGLDSEIVAYARSGIPTAELRADDLLADIHEQRDRTRYAREEAEYSQHEAEKLYDDLRARLDKIEDERRGILETARKEAEGKVNAVEEELRTLRRKLARARQPLEVVEEVEDHVADLEAEVAEPVKRRAPAGTRTPRRPRRAASRPLKLGDKVRLRGLGSEGVLTAISEDSAEVQIGVLRVRTRLNELELARPPAAATPAEVAAKARAAKAPASSQERKKSPARAAGASTPGIELDLRGQRVEDALKSLDDYLDSGFLASMPWVRIIHGKGTGRLRKAVREELQKHPHIKSFESGKHGEGGDGVTVAKFKL